MDKASDIRDGFKFRGGHLALDLTATLIGRKKPVQKDLLAGPTDLGRWLVAAGLSETTELTDNDLALAREVRERIYRLAMARIGGTALDEVDRTGLNALTQTAAAPVLTADGTARWSGPPRALLASVAAEAIWLLGNERASRIRQCEGEVCAILFYDTAHARPRRWCAMQACGNKAKATQFRRRHLVEGQET